jgi:hypothetical protein
MRPWRRTLSRLLAKSRMTPEERADLCAERCLETLCDSERVPAGDFGEREQEALEAERRRWATSA